MTDTMTRTATVLAVDLGKTSCRVRLSTDGEVVTEAHGIGAPGLADAHGARLSFEAIADAVDQLDADLPAGVPIGIGAAGSEAAPAAAHALIGLLRERFAGPIAIINDALAAHAGAFAGAPGTMLIAGTGAVVFAVDDKRRIGQVDGWGPWLGDEGSGQWIGRHGLMAAVRAHDRRGQHTVLLALATDLTGDISTLPHWVSETGAPARQLGTFAPTVLDAANSGDAVAVEIVEHAAAHLADTCAAAGLENVCVAGGLAAHPFLAARIAAALEAHGLRQVEPAGDALTGAHLVAIDRTLPYEERILRG
ncbi:N-acetylglucosamine kinase [Leifsonia sp. NPDC058292]|uniref:N-acetylglucosamine kinase n=1 Tax=Leifsonia sp. NPDC058292 TaxID=3346428 RepID=UPI0036DE8281